jgi:hypothetical protein
MRILTFTVPEFLDQNLTSIKKLEVEFQQKIGTWIITSESN